MESLIVLLVLAVLAVPVLLVVALVSISGLKQRVASLEDDVARWRAAGVHAAPAHAPPSPPTAPAAPVFDRGMAQPLTLRDPPPSVAAAPPSRPVAPRPDATEPVAPTVIASTVRATRPARPDPMSLAVRAIKRWFTVGNVPVKVGMLVLFAGVAALLKYASDQGWMTLPIELRLAGIGLAALAGLIFGWRQREIRRGFALSLQGGAVGVMLLLVFAAFKLYPLLPAGAAFALSVVIVAGVGVLAVAQNAVALAWLGILAGFLAPIWLSTGGGNHVALFGYYAVLNAAIFMIGWWRSWRALNVLGFVFTFGIGALWGAWNFRAEKFASTQPFLLLFFLTYLLIPILYARRRPATRRDVVDGCLVFGTPLVAFSLQAGLLQGSFPEQARMLLAYCALALGALYAMLAWWLRRREHFAALVAPYAALAVGFATLAVPLALSAQATASVFALEGAALAWLGLRQQRRLPQVSGVLLQLLAAGSFVIGISGADAAVPAALNARFMGALLIALAGFGSAWSYRRADATSTPGGLYYLWGLSWWLGNGLVEIDRHVEHAHRVDAALVFVVATGWLVAEVHRRLPARALAWTVALALASALPAAWAQAIVHAHPFQQFGIVAWLAYALLGWRSLRCLRDEVGVAPVAFAHSTWLWAWPLAIGLFLQVSAEQAQLGEGWRLAAFALPWLLVAAFVQWRPDAIATPLAQRFVQWRARLQGAFVLALAVAATVALFVSGDAQPLLWFPLFNPLDLAQLAVLVLLLKWLASDLAPAGLQPQRIRLIAMAAFALVTVITLRATHHWGGVAWNTSMFSTSLVQASLSIVWSVLGVLGWIVGSRRGQRSLWLGGAILMAVVLAKLVLVDRQHLGNLLGIASFIAYGLLCTAVGYFAPAPPRELADDAQMTGESA